MQVLSQREREKHGPWPTLRARRLIAQKLSEKPYETCRRRLLTSIFPRM